MAPLFWERPPEVDETEFKRFLSTEAESVAEFRARLNISDIWIEWSLLTEHEKAVEVNLTPKLWKPNSWYNPPSIACTPVTNTRGESLSLFFPADHESDRAYVFEIDGDYIGQPVHRDFSPKNQTGGLQLFEEITIGSFFVITQLPQLDLYTLTRLLIPHNNVVLF